MSLKISVIVPIYNVDKYLQACLDSLVNQTYKSLEIILVDDGSTDGSSVICDCYCRKYTNFIVCHKKNGGLVSARKAGISIATGDYISYLDGDDWLNSDYYLNISKYLDNNRVDILCMGFSFVYANGCVEKNLPYLSAGLYKRKQIENDIIPIMLYTTPYYNFGIKPSVCTKVMRREFVENFQNAVPEEITIGEDAAVTYPVLLVADSLFVCDECGYQYRYNESSLTHQIDMNLGKRLLVLYDYLASYFKEKPTLKTQFINYIAMLSYKLISRDIHSMHTIRYVLEHEKLYFNNIWVKQAIKYADIGRFKKFVLACFENKNIFVLCCVKKLLVMKKKLIR